jgi:class 3 adenylate cyclase
MVCPACGALNGPDARFCDQCGRRLTPSMGGLEAGDRRLVTAVFADLVDYSRMVAELDPEDVRSRVDAAFVGLSGAVERYGGTTEKFIGDAVFAVFGAPRARDDDAVRAAICALAMRDVLNEGRDLERESNRESSLGTSGRDDGLRLRIGIATGEVVAAPRDLAGQHGLAFTGQAVTMAARLQQLAAAGEIVVDQATVDAARGRLMVERLEHHVSEDSRRRAKRHDRSTGALYRVLGVRAQSARATSSDPFVGRGLERRVLRDELDQVSRTGRGRVLLVVGEPGMGKTRLASDLERDARARGFAWTWTENVSYRSGEPYAHTRLIAERVADEHALDAGSFARKLLFDPDADPDTVRRISGAIAAIARDAAFSGWEEELKLTPSDPGLVSESLAELADRYVRSLVEQYGPRVLVVDDLHWQDPSSGRMTDRLMIAAADVPMLVIATMRPGPIPEWAELGHVSQIDLGGLDTSETYQLAASVARLDLGEDDASRLHERTAGNPLFIRETVRTLLSDADAVRGGRLHVRATRSGRLPVTLHAVLGARIDALAPEARAVLQVGSVCGITFDEATVGRLLDADRAGRGGVGEGPIDASAPFVQLAGAGLIEAADAPGVWRFVHPLILDVAYASLLGPRKRKLHARLADVLEERGSRLAVGRLARHRAAAGDRARALPLLEIATGEALAVGAAEEAAGFLELAAGLAVDDLEHAQYERRAIEIRDPRTSGQVRRRPPGRVARHRRRLRRRPRGHGARP